MKTTSSKHIDTNIFDNGNDTTIQGEPTTDDDQQENNEHPWSKEMREQFWFPFLDMLPDESEFDMELSGKFLLLKSILDKCADIGDKILLFSRSLYTLNYIERFLQYLHQQNEREYQQQCESRRQLRQLLASSNGNYNEQQQQSIHDYILPPVQWQRDADYFRMDGQTDVQARKRYAEVFNDLVNIRARLFLISTLAGGIGINLVGSNRVIIFDASWNPR
jgi:transcriptional regulator ATRX